MPIAPNLAVRAERLARAAVAALPPVSGYFGIDLILGPATDGTQDVVIEVNPRLTFSYVALRQLATSNLAAAMLAVATGKPCELSFRQRSLEFCAQ